MDGFRIWNDWEEKMITLKFFSGNDSRIITIKDKIIFFTSPLLNNSPIKIDLNKLKENEKIIKNANINQHDLKIITNMKNEEERAKSIIDDFKKSGWRLIDKIYG
jgi:hypothetical protein